MLNFRNLIRSLLVLGTLFVLFEVTGGAAQTLRYDEQDTSFLIPVGKKDKWSCNLQTAQIGTISRPDGDSGEILFKSIHPKKKKKRLRKKIQRKVKRLSYILSGKRRAKLLKQLRKLRKLRRNFRKAVKACAELLGQKPKPKPQPTASPGATPDPNNPNPDPSAAPTPTPKYIKVKSPVGPVWTKDKNVNFNVDFETTLNGFGFVDWDNSLVGWYRGENGANDVSGNNNHCTLKGDTSIGSGKFGQAFILDGDGDAIVCDDTDNPDFQFKGNSSFTLSAWVRSKEIGGYLFSKGSGRPGYALFWHSSGPRYQFMVGHAYSFSQFTYPYVVPPNPTAYWNHVAAVYDTENKKVKIYLNGAPSMSLDLPFNYYLDKRNALTMGSGFKGRMDELMIFKRVLRDEEIAKLFSAQNLDLTFSASKELVDYPYTVYFVDETGFRDAYYGNVMVDTPSSTPEVILTSPLTQTKSSSSTQQFKCSVRSTNSGVKLKSVALHWDYQGNFRQADFKNVSTEGEVTFTKSGLSDAAIKWNCYACDSNNNCGFADSDNTLIVGDNNYYIATNGDDQNAGTINAPFKTIQKCADVALPGDTCLMRAGTYRETITPANSGHEQAQITFKPYNNEHVVVSGADPVTGWSQQTGQIYAAAMNWDLGRGKNQVFVDGKMMFLSRWPNTPSLDVMKPAMKTIEGGRDVNSDFMRFTLKNSELTQPDNFWQEAIVFFTNKPKYWTHTGIVESSQSEKLTFNMTKRGYGTYPEWGKFLLMGTYGMLDSEGEWYRNPNTGNLHLWKPGGGNPEGLVEAKARQLAFDLSDRHHITIKGLNIFAAGIFSTPTSHHNIIDSIDAKYVFHFTLFGDKAEATTFEGSYSGILIDGHDNLVTKSHVQYSAGNGIGVRGERQKIERSEIHDVDYIGAYYGTIQMMEPRTRDIEIYYNKLYNSGRDVLQHAGTQRMKLMYNEMYNTNVGRLTSDLGVTYANSADYDGTEIAYNIVHDEDYTYGGFYLDYRGSNVKIHHNVVYGCYYSLILHSPENYIIDNNTLVSPGLSVAGRWWVDAETPGKDLATFRNNIYTGGWLAQDYYYTDNNMKDNGGNIFVDKVNHDYHLSSGSSAIDRGLNLGYPQDLEGNPVPRGDGVDLGAYESPYSNSTKGPSGHWKFEGNVNDSINNFHGSLHGNAVIATDSDKGNVLSLDGDGDYVSLPWDMLIGETQVTMSAWIKTTASNGSIFMHYDNSGSYVYFLNVYNGKAEACMSNVNQGDCYSADVTSSTNVNDGAWHFIAAVSTGTEEILYVDGIEASRISKAVHLYDGWYLSTIGLQGWQAESPGPQRAKYFTGLIDDVLIYGRGLSSSEIVTLCNSQKPTGASCG